VTGDVGETNGKTNGPAAVDRRPPVLTLCTGNAARSVMAGAMLRASGVDVVTAGTHVVDGQPMSRRTRDALASLGYRVDGHRSCQVTPELVGSAGLVLAMAGEHIAYIRREFPGAAAKTASIKRLCRDLPSGPGSLAERIGGLGLGDLPIEPWEDVEDPAGGEDEVYRACVKELADLCAELAPRLG
jgi:protein-tyrosine-phosphatase